MKYYYIIEEIIALYILFAVFFHNEIMKFLIRHTLLLSEQLEHWDWDESQKGSLGTVVEVELFIRRNRNRCPSSQRSALGLAIDVSQAGMRRMK